VVRASRQSAHDRGDAGKPCSSVDPPEAEGARRPLILLGLGLVLGVALAGRGLLADREQAGRELLRGNAAVVNGTPIARAEFQRAVAALQADRSEPLDHTETEQLLERMIDEELLVQHGVALGLLQHDRRIRSEITAAVISSVVFESEAHEASLQELQAYYDRNRDLFTTPGRLRVRQIFLSGPQDPSSRSGETAARAAEAARRLREGEPFERVRAELGDEAAVGVPDALLPPTKLAEYMGAPIVRSLMGAKPGEVSGPWRSPAGYHVVEIREREAARIPAFDQIEAEVRDAYRRDQSDKALSEYLQSLRASSEILIGEPDS